MIYYAILVPISLIITLLGILLSPILPLFAVEKYWWLDNHSKEGMGLVLPNWLNWFNTPDNDLFGDATFQRINGKSYWSCVTWLCRNPAYSFGLKYIGTPYQISYKGDNSIKDNDNAKEGWLYVSANGLFQFVYIKRIFTTNRCIYINLGWNIRVLVDNNILKKPELIQATFVFSPRISGFR